MKRNILWLFLGMAIMGGARAAADCITFDGPAVVAGGSGCLQGLVAPNGKLNSAPGIHGTVITTMPPTFEPDAP